jgi:outer membrane protein OmpA-like peptidoglycan-associated protein
MKAQFTRCATILCFAIFLTGVVHGQDKKAITEAQKWFNMKSYEKALSIYMEAGKSSIDPLINYQIGICLMKSMPPKPLAAIPYFEKAIPAKAPVPITVHFELAQLYARNEDLAKAIEQAKLYSELTKVDKKAQAEVNQFLEACARAKAFMTVPRNFTVQPFPGNVNTEYTEYNPVVSADESVMAFTALRPKDDKVYSGIKQVEEILITYNTTGNWSATQPLKIAEDKNVGTAGISADGSKMMIFMGSVDDPGSLFQISRAGDKWSQPSLIASALNSKSLETTASISPDGKVIYFASDRPGTLGGLDLWKIEKSASGVWSAPVNLGPSINSKADEDAPSLHPDMKTLFFTSNGHNTMGGRDIFVTHLANGKWTSPENMGYPVNTTSNDDYFTLLADGSRGYFSSDRKGGKGGQDIYTIDMPANASKIPLTMVKGKITNLETGKPMPTKMYVVDNSTKKEIEYVYDPDPKTGNYLIILPPAKNYDIIIECEGFLPYTLNVNIPNQDYFYELYQQIQLKTIRQFDVIVGQEVLVTNAFYDNHTDIKTDIRKAQEAKLAQSGQLDIHQLMDDLFAAGDKEGLEYLTEILMMHPVEEIDFKSSKAEVASRIYYYDETDESEFEKKQVEGKTVLSLPTMYVTDLAKSQKETKQATQYDPAVLNKIIKVYFDAGKSEVKAQYNTELDQFLKILNDNPSLGVEISGFASSEGTEEVNRELSNKRATTVLEYLNHKGIVRRRIVAKGYGVTKVENATQEEGRRVEVKIVDLIVR